MFQNPHAGQPDGWAGLGISWWDLGILVYLGIYTALFGVGFSIWGLSTQHADMG